MSFPIDRRLYDGFGTCKTDFRTKVGVIFPWPAMDDNDASTILIFYFPNKLYVENNVGKLVIWSDALE